MKGEKEEEKRPLIKICVQDSLVWTLLHRIEQQSMDLTHVEQTRSLRKIITIKKKIKIKMLLTCFCVTRHLCQHLPLLLSLLRNWLKPWTFAMPPTQYHKSVAGNSSGFNNCHLSCQICFEGKKKKKSNAFQETVNRPFYTFRIRD